MIYDLNLGDCRARHLSNLFGELKRRNVFRVAAVYAAATWLILESTSVVLPIMEAPQWFHRILLALLAFGFPIALLLSWAYEFTPDGIKRDEEVRHHEAPAYTTAKRLDVITIGLMVLAVAFVLMDRFWFKPLTEIGQPPPTARADADKQAQDVPAFSGAVDIDQIPSVSVAGEPPPNSIAVLPFVNMSADPENQYFSDGITEEIISKLTRVRDLAVASRASVIRFNNSDLDIKDIAASLGVRYILEGSVRKAGSRVRITAQLSDSQTGFNLWAEDFDGMLEDVFDTQEKTALSIVEALNLKLTPQEQQAVQRRYINNAEAYNTYLRGQALVQFFSDPNKLMAARGHFESALELEPNYPPALAGLASVEAQIYRNVDPAEERLVRATELANRALELDPELVRGHIAIGEIVAMRYDYRAAVRKFRKALALEPDNPWAWDLLSWSLAYQQPPEPVEAEAAAREAIRLQPQFSYAYYHLGRALLLQGRVEEAISAFQHIVEFDPEADTALLGLMQANLASGNYEQAQQLGEEILASEETPVVLVYLSYVLAAEGDRHGALDRLETAFELGYRDFAALDAASYLTELRQDSRYVDLIKRYQAKKH